LDTSAPRRMNERDRHAALLSAQAEALRAGILLDALRAGRLANALELPEQELDSGVLMIHKLSESADVPERERVEATLRLAREYRHRHSRKAEAIFEGIAESDMTAVKAAQEKARKTLDETK
jgi:hypothetical protein